MRTHEAAWRLPVQATPYSCGPACLVGVGRLLGVSLDEAALMAEADCRPEVGTDNAVLAALAAKYLPVLSVGARTYVDGLAIWNIRNPLSGVGHFVIVLGERGGRVRYYDPYWAGVFELAREAIEFVSGDGQWVQWSINFDSARDWYDAEIVAEGDFNEAWALRSLRRWRARHAAPVLLPARRCPLGGECNCRPAEACRGA